MNAALDQLLDELADRLAARIAERLRGPAAADVVSQVESPLGSRRHCAAVRRRIARGEGGASVVGRRHLLSPEALAEELQRTSSRATAAGKAPSPASVRAELARDLKLVRGGGR